MSEEAQKGDSNMSIYMLNLVFDASTIPANATGRFNDYINVTPNRTRCKFPRPG
jgi:hypothetical protein